MRIVVDAFELNRRLRNHTSWISRCPRSLADWSLFPSPSLEHSFLSLPPGIDPASIPGPSFSSPTFQIAPDSFGVFLPNQQPLFGDGGGGERNGFDPTLQSSLPVSSVDYGLQQLSQGGNDNGNGEDFLQPRPQQLAGALQLLDFQSPPPPLPLPASSYSSNAAPTQSLTSATMQALSTLEYDQLQRLHNLISRRLGEQALAFTSTPAELGDFSSRQRELLHHYMTLVSPTLIALSSEDQARKQPHFLPLALRAMEVSFSVPSNRSTSTPDKTPAGGATPASLTVSGGASTSSVSTPSSTTSGSNSGPRSDETNPVLHALLAVSSAHRANLALNISNDDGAWRRQATINRAKAFQLLREFAAQAAAERKVGSPPGSSTRNREVVATTLMLLALTTVCPRLNPILLIALAHPWFSSIPSSWTVIRSSSQVCLKASSGISRLRRSAMSHRGPPSSGASWATSAACVDDVGLPCSKPTT